MIKKFLVNSFAAVFIVLCVIGCSRKEESASADPPAVEEPSPAPSVVAAPTPEPTPSAEEIHRSVVSTAKVNLAILQGTLPVGGEGNNDPVWAGQIKTGNADNSVSVCDLYERYQSGNAVADDLKQKIADLESDFHFSDAEIGLSQKAAEAVAQKKQ